MPTDPLPVSNEKINLPTEAIHKVTVPLARFLKIEAAAGALLLVTTVLAVAVANSAWAEPFLSIWSSPAGAQIGAFGFHRSLLHWINDGLMTLFFFVVALELKREIVLGELRHIRLALLPLAGAIGGMFFPALVFLVLMRGRAEAHGWGVVMATDTAFVIGCLALLGSRIPSSLRIFLLSLAIFDDVGAILVVAFGYGGSLSFTALCLSFLVLAIITIISRLGVRSVPVYFLLGLVTWLCFDSSGIHPTIAGVLLGLMTPARSWVNDERLRAILNQVLSYPRGEHWSGDTVDRKDLGKAGAAARESLSPLERIEMRLHPWVGFAIMPIFALANAGVRLPGADFGQPLILAIGAGLVLGKPLGVFLMSWLAVRLGLATLFPGLTWPVLAAGCFLTGIGFTMSIFIAGLAFPASIQADAKIGILMASVISATLGVTALWLTSRNGRLGQHRSESLTRL